MQAHGRGKRVSDEAITAAGIRIGLERLTVRGVAKAIGASEMTLYRRAGGVAGLRRMVANAIVRDTPLPLPRGADPELELIAFAQALREFVIEHPGIGSHLADLSAQDSATLAKIEESQRSFADHFGWPSEKASVLISVVAEHAVALGQLNPASHRRPRKPSALPEHLPTIRAGAASVSDLSPEQRFAWSMRATIRGTMEMLEL